MTWTPLTNSELPDGAEQTLDGLLDFMPSGAAQLDTQGLTIFKHNGHAYVIYIDELREVIVAYKPLGDS